MQSLRPKTASLSCTEPAESYLRWLPPGATVPFCARKFVCNVILPQQSAPHVAPAIVLSAHYRWVSSRGHVIANLQYIGMQQWILSHGICYNTRHPPVFHLVRSYAVN